MLYNYINIHTGIRGRKTLILVFRFFVLTAGIGLRDRKYCLIVGCACLGFLNSFATRLNVVLTDPACDRELKRFAPRCVLFWDLTPAQILLVIARSISSIGICVRLAIAIKKYYFNSPNKHDHQSGSRYID